MTLRLVLESFSHPQKRGEARLADGQLVIGRGEDCGWQLDDPQQFVSRQHCVVVGQGGQYRVTDLSSGGLFIDAAPAPLGRGVTAVLAPGMRLRLSDFVIRVEVDHPAAAQAPAPPKNAMFGDDFFTPQPEAPKAPRPASLPDPFDIARSEVRAEETPPPRPTGGGFFDDPFTMDHNSRVVTPVATPEPPAKPSSGFDFGDFGLPADLGQPGGKTPPAPAAAEAPPPQSPPPAQDLAPVVVVETSFQSLQAEPVADPFANPPEAPQEASRVVIREVPPEAPPPPPTPPAEPAAPTRMDPFDASAPAHTPAASGPSDSAALAALMRGMGITPPAGFTGSPEEMEAIGRRYRAMADGLVQLLRMRAQEKGAARVAQTVIGAANVNPLKFLVGGDEVVSALITAKGAGYLDPDAAIAASIGDLMDHHKRSWSGLQASLRRMVDRFDPALFEADVEDVGMLKALVAGSRPARLWQLYSDRYREIAKAAEDRFLGEVGVDFRDAYEGETRRTDNGTA